jgi:hydrogenase maturation protease
MTAALAPGTASQTAARVLLAGVGYSNLRDLSFGPVMVERLRRRDWPSGVQIEDMSYGAVAALHWFRESPRPGSVIFVASTARGDAPGSVRSYELQEKPRPTDDEVQLRVTEAVTGIISLDGLLAVARHFDVLPEQVRIVEVEPGEETWGDGFSPAVSDQIEAIEGLIDQHVMELLA